MCFHSHFHFLFDSLLDPSKQFITSALVGVAAGGDEESKVDESGED